VRSVLVVRLSARGDVMFATPIVRALRRTWPEAKLTWVVEPAASDVVRWHPELDEVVVWDRPAWKRMWRERRWGELWRAFRDFRSSLRRRRFDLAIDMQGLLRSGMVSYFSGAPVRIGLGPQEGNRLFVTHTYPTGNAIEEMSAEPRLMAEWLGLDTSEWALDLHLAPDALAGAQAALAGAGVRGPFALLVPFTTRPWKHWVERRWAPLGRRLLAEHGLPVVLVGGPDDREAADRILAHAEGDVVDLVGKTSLTEAVAVVSEASLVIGVDTALTHAAHGFHRPTVCVFGPIGYSEPPTPQARMLRHWLPCVPCRGAGRPIVCGGAYTCMDLISIDEITAQARDLLTLFPPASPRSPAASSTVDAARSTAPDTPE
jgi:heptosyltransferase-1